MKALIVYATTEGQTRKIAEAFAERVRQGGHEVELCDSEDLLSHLDVASFDLIVLAASVHQKQHQESIVDFAMAHRDTLQNKTSAFISVSLSAAMGPEGEEEAQGYIRTFTEVTGWPPAHALALGGALLYSEYDFFKEQIIKHVVLGDRGADVATRDQEFTDWQRLEAFADTVVEDAATSS